MKMMMYRRFIIIGMNRTNVLFIVAYNFKMVYNKIRSSILGLVIVFYCV